METQQLTVKEVINLLACGGIDAKPWMVRLVYDGLNVDNTSGQSHKFWQIDQIEGSTSECMISYGAVGQSRHVTYKADIPTALKKANGKLRKGYVNFVAPQQDRINGSDKYCIIDDAGDTTMYPLSINDFIDLTIKRNYVPMPLNVDLCKAMRADEVKLFMDKDMCFWIVCKHGDVYTMGKLKYNRDGKSLPIK